MEEDKGEPTELMARKSRYWDVLLEMGRGLPRRLAWRNSGKWRGIVGDTTRPPAHASKSG